MVPWKLYALYIVAFVSTRTKPIPHTISIVSTQHQLKIPDPLHHSEHFTSHFMPQVETTCSAID